METMDPGISAAYEACRRLQRRHDPTYYWATRRLPADVRPATHALYGYVRTADQIVDGPHRPPTPAARRAALDAWEDELHRGLAGNGAPHPVVGALVDAGERHDLPLDELGPYMRSMRVDCGPVRISSWDELDVYMDGSAGSVGRIMAPLLGVPERFHADFGHLGQAFQLANFIRDVREDWAMDRIYMPAEDRERLGVAEEDFGRRARDARRCARWWPSRSRGRGRCSRPPSRRSRPRRRRCAPGSGWRARPTAASSTAPRRPAATCSAAASACAPATSRGVLAAVRRR